MPSIPTQIPGTTRIVRTKSEPTALHREGAGRYFFVGLAWFFVLVAAVGFAPSYAGVQTPRGPIIIPPIVHVHGALMIAWLLLFVAQTGLAAAGALQWHRLLGLAAVGLAAALWLSMGIVTVNSLIRYKVEDFPWIYKILLVELLSLVVFPLFFVWGIRVRRNAGAHKRLLTLATLFLLQAAVDRMRWLPEFHLPGFWSHALRLYPLLIPLFVFDFVSLKRFHPITLIGTGVILAAHTIVNLLWNLPAWHNFVHAMVISFR